MCQEHTDPQPQPAASIPLPPPNQETLRHILLGDYAILRDTIHTLHRLGYADAGDWSKPMLTGRGGEYVSILTQRRASNSGERPAEA
ncbi:hypothetical protein [Pseudanabaena sp. FACHB-2040]|uniref:hypothetical protein n=1 Tax=Pseudanabaena sp. FACHB-2040 TaxID=2692859 RepID=UPI001686182E|nr:hypothetical protein [Pseudanabaena sp. FACHB-2040]MBD2260610.1 hypothetical protein [Pseudanabaena sp. FACHB-2040]